MTEELRALFKEDIELIQEYLDGFECYGFSEDLRQRMQKAALSSSALGERALVSHTIVDKWLRGKAKPNGKERMKELGMALGMDASELDTFLYKNGYPKLYAKNPMDSAAKLLLFNTAGKPEVVRLYRELVRRLGLALIPVPEDRVLCDTTAMSTKLKEAAAQGKISGWFQEHEKNFTGDAKKQLTDMRIIRYIMLYVGESTINEMAVTGELPASLKNLLYSLVGGKTVHVRGLREKLIAFGLYANMTEEEIDILLEYARLRIISEPVSRSDLAVLLALRTAHERYPYYEFENLSRIVQQMEQSSEPYDRIFLPEYRKRLDNARQMVEYYDRYANDTEKTLFEKNYTSYSDRGVMDYVRDMFALLCREELLDEKEIEPIWKLIQRTDTGIAVWNSKGAEPWN